MKKIVSFCLLSIFSLPLIGVSQEKPVQSEDKGRVVVTGFARKKTVQNEEKGDVVVMAQNTNAPMILYVINDKYYLGDTTGILIRRLDASKIKKIAEIRDEERKLKYSEKTGKFSKQVQVVLFIETDEKIELSPAPLK